MTTMALVAAGLEHFVVRGTEDRRPGAGLAGQEPAQPAGGPPQGDLQRAGRAPVVKLLPFLKSYVPVASPYERS
jgi:hypothetical protein